GQTSRPVCSSSATAYGPLPEIRPYTRPPTTDGANMPPISSWPPTLAFHTSLPVAASSATTSPASVPANTHPLATTGTDAKLPVIFIAVSEVAHPVESRATSAKPRCFTADWSRVLERSWPYEGHSPLGLAGAEHATDAVAA